MKTSIAAAVAASVPGQIWIREAFGTPLAVGLSDPAIQPKFTNFVPNALDPGFIFDTADGEIRIGAGQAVQYTGLIDVNNNDSPAPTKVWGYGQLTGKKNKPRVPGLGFTWPGRTIVAQSGMPLEVKWENRLIDGSGNPLPLPVTSMGRSVVDKSLHWAYSLHGYESYSLESDGFPIVPHVHGGHTDFQFDGNPEFFFSPEFAIKGPQFVEQGYMYDNSQPAGTVWYHDHALGITRLNVYAGMAGFYIIRDDFDTGLEGNGAGLPAFPYETALAIQDKMFHTDGSLFYPAYPGDPFYADFIYGEGADLSAGSPDYFGEFDNPNAGQGDPPEPSKGYGPTGLAEFFGDHMVVNGVIWPKMDVEPRNYRLRLLNGCDSRFLVVRFRAVAPGVDVLPSVDVSPPIPFKVIGSDQGLASSPTTTDTLVVETGSRYDVLFDFGGLNDKRIIMENIGGDTPFGFDFGDDLPEEDVFPDRQTDRIMAFDVSQPLSSIPDATPNTAALATYAAVRSGAYSGYQFGPVARTRKVALFEGTDEFGRLQPLLGTAEPATDYNGDPVNWPTTENYVNAGLVGQMEGAIAWHSPTTENPKLGDTEVWEVFNVTGDSHPVHLHLVHFDVMGRRKIVWDSATNEDDRVLADSNDAAGDGTYLLEQPVVQHNGDLGNGFKVVNPTMGAMVDAGVEYVDGTSPKDMVTARPDEVTIIKAKFDKPGRYVWHCHILSHEDHEMMRVMHVGPLDPGEPDKPGKPGKPPK